MNDENREVAVHHGIIAGLNSIFHSLLSSEADYYTLYVCMSSNKKLRDFVPVTPNEKAFYLNSDQLQARKVTVLQKVFVGDT